MPLSNTSSFFSCYVQSGAMFSVLLFSVKYKLFEKNSQQKTAVYKTAVFTIIVQAFSYISASFLADSAKSFTPSKALLRLYAFIN